VIERPVKSKEDMDSLADRFAEDITYTVSPQAAKEGRYGISRSQGLDEISWPFVANQESIRDTRASRATCSGSARETSGPTVWAMLVCMESDISRGRYRLAKMAASLKTMAAAMWERRTRWHRRQFKTV
jgi:hypothetical protein